MTEFLNLSDSAKACNISRKTLYAHIKSGKVSVTRHEGKRGIAVSELLRAYGNIDLAGLQQLNTRLQQKNEGGKQPNDTDLLLLRLHEIQEENKAIRIDLTTVKESLKESLVLMLENQKEREERENDAERLKEENKALKAELESNAKRGFWGWIRGL